MIYTTRQLSSVPMQVKDPPTVTANREFTNGLVAAGKTLITKESLSSRFSASAIPTEAEVAQDTAAFIKSIQTLASLLLTSSAFRLILSDVLSTAREIVADSVETIRETAEIVERFATTVEDAVRPGGLDTKQSVDAISIEETQVEAKTEEPEVKDLKEVILDRVEDVCTSRHYQHRYLFIFFFFRSSGKRKLLRHIIPPSELFSSSFESMPQEYGSLLQRYRLRLEMQ